MSHLILEKFISAAEAVKTKADVIERCDAFTKAALECSNSICAAEVAAFTAGFLMAKKERKLAKQLGRSDYTGAELAVMYVNQSEIKRAERLLWVESYTRQEAVENSKKISALDKSVPWKP